MSNAADTIQAAIDKLERERADASLGPWDMEGDDKFGYGFGGPENAVVLRGEVLDEDAALIVTLHRTIDAQLAILRHVQSFHQGDLGIGTNRHVVNLATAILGEES